MRTRLASLAAVVAIGAGLLALPACSKDTPPTEGAPSVIEANSRHPQPMSSSAPVPAPVVRPSVPVERGVPSPATATRRTARAIPLAATSPLASLIAPLTVARDALSARLTTLRTGGTPTTATRQALVAVLDTASARTRATLVAAPPPVPPPPVARFTVTCGAVAYHCTLDATSSQNASTYAWRLGRYTGATEDVASGAVLASVDYYQPGPRTVTLTTSGAGGTASTTQTFTVPAPVVTPTPAPAESASTTVTPLPAPAPPPSGTVAELPRVTVDVSQRPAAARIVNVPAGASLQSALDAAQPGDELHLASGATYVGTFVYRRASAGWVTLVTEGAALPPTGTRLTSAGAVPLATLLTPNMDPALTVLPGARGLWVRGIVFAAAGTVYDVVRVGALGPEQSSLTQVPADIVFEQVAIRGTPTAQVKNCLVVNGARLAVVDSDVRECHAQGQESHAIVGYNTPGPLLIANNRLEGAGINVLLGGATPTISGLTINDVEILGNSIYKPLAWKGKFSVKNLLEFKNVQRARVEGNVLENNWSDAQDGVSVLFKTSSDGGANVPSWLWTRDITFRNNILRAVPAGFSIAARPENGGSPMRNVLVENNLVEVGANAENARTTAFLVTGDLTNVVIQRNTVTAVGPVNSFLTLDDAGVHAQGMVFRDNVVPSGDYGAKGSGASTGTASLSLFWPGGLFTGNAIVAAPPGYGASVYPAGNTFPASAPSSGGADVTAVQAATAGAVAGQRVP